MVTGVLGAMAQNEIRRILSFHIVSQIGYMLMGLALLTPLALAGSVFYIIHHILVKTNLFLIGGIAEQRFGTGRLEATGGLYRSAPILSLLFFLSAMSLAGIPPLSGFFAKLTLVRSALDADSYLIVVVTSCVSLLTLFSMTKIWSAAFWKPAPDKVVDGVDPVSQPVVQHMDSKSQRRYLYTPIIGLLVLSLGIGLLSGPMLRLSIVTAEQLLDPDAYIAAVLPAERILEHPPTNPESLSASNDDRPVAFGDQISVVVKENEVVSDLGASLP